MNPRRHKVNIGVWLSEEMVGEIVFIGLGLHDEFGMSLRGQAEARSCDFLFAELYTNAMPSLNLRDLATITGREVTLLSRKDVEEHPEKSILSRARSGKVGFLVPGDPMVATTHVDLRLRAHKTGIRTRIIHAGSVSSAICGVTGLQSYKFGRTVTIPVSLEGDIFPASIYFGIKNNMASGLHSLVLLELDVEGKRQVSISEGLERLLAFCERKQEHAITVRTLVVGAARLEAPDMIVRAGMVEDVARCNFGDPPFAMVFPGKLHFVEAEALHVFCGAPKGMVDL